MHSRFRLAVIITLAGCAGEPDGDALDNPGQAVLGSCGLGDQVVASETLTPASIPSLSALDGAQIIAAVHESAHTDVTTVAEAFSRVDDHLINRIVLRDEGTNQFYTELEFGAGDNSYGAIFGKGTTTRAVAIHDGDFYGCAVFR